MKKFSGGVRGGTVGVSKKVFSVSLLLALLLQPLGTPLLLGVFLLSPTTVIAQDSDPSAEASFHDGEEPNKDGAPTEVADSEPVEGEEATIGETTEAEEETDTIEPVSEGTETPEAAAAETSESSEDSKEKTEEGSITDEAASTEEDAEDADRTVCLNNSDAIKNSTDNDWETKEDGKIAETVGKVQLGVKYAFPGREDVSVTFTCLPGDEAKRSTLKIEEISTNDLNLPEGIVAVSEHAYDITTGMENGEFKYDLELSKNASGNFGISYIEKSAEEAVSENLSPKDIKNVESKQVDNKEESIEASGLDHFTIFFPTINVICQNDVNGANDVSGQKDLTLMCRSTDNSSSVSTKWDWDDISWSGGNTGDACNLFDTDNDGNANYAICVTIGGTPASIQTTTRYSCNDSKADRCAGKTALALSANTACEVNITNTDPFSAGSASPSDTQAICSIDLADVGGASSAKLIDVCSYPSQEPNSDPSDCIIATQAATGKLEVVKNLSPINDSGTFNLLIDGTTLASGVSNGGTTGEQVVLAAAGGGTAHTFAESGANGTSLSNYTTTVSCKDNNGTGSVVPVTGTNPWTINVVKDKDVVCTITNTRVNNASLTIIKDAVPNDAQDFSFITNGTGLSNFSLDDDADNTLSNTKTFSNLGAGSYSVAEGAVAGWTQTSATCSDGSPVNNISLSAGENVTCTFTNTKDATLTLEKTVTNDNGGEAVAADFQGKIDGNNVPWGVAQVVSLGAHTASETSLTGYAAGAWGGDCAANGAVTLAAGENKTCTITNDDIQPTLTVIKIVDNGDGGDLDPVDFTMQVTSEGASLIEFPGDEAGTVVDINAGDYSVEEVLVDGYTPNYSDDCEGTIAVGENKVCTITNDDQQAYIIVDKTVVNNNGGSAVPDDFSLTIDDNAVLDGVAYPVNPGSHTADETTLPGYAAGAWGGDCAENGTVSVALGETKTCTITNDDTFGRIFVQKETLPDGDQTEFEFNPSWSTDNFFLADGEKNDSGILVPGQYSITESEVAGWDMTNITCFSEGSQIALDLPSNPEDETVNLNLTAGQIITCTFTNTKAGKITIEKQTIGGDGEFTFTGDVAGELSDNETKTEEVAPGIYTATETGETGWDLTGISCNERQGSGGNLETGTATFDVDPGEEVTCVFTNTKRGSIKIIKNTIGGDGTFDFTGDTGVSQLTTTNGTASQTVEDVLPGSYSIAETVPAGWDLTSASCDNQSTIEDIEVLPGQTTTCTFENTKKGHLIVHKVTDPANDTTLFDVTIDGDGTVTGNVKQQVATNQDVDYEVTPGTYSVSEDETEGWQETANTCDDVVVAAGETEECTITNQKDAFIIVKKETNPDGDKTSFEFDPSYGENFTLSDGEENNSGDLAPGIYSVAENTPEDWDLTDTTCVSSNQDTETADNISLEAGETITCTFTNTKRGHIIVDKVTNPAQSGEGAQSFEFVTTGEGYQSFSLTDEAEPNNQSLVPGTYGVAETVPGGWDLASVTCQYGRGQGQDNLDPANLVLEAGETIYCTFTNEKRGEIIVTKIFDRNGDGKVDEGEEALGDWTMNLNELSQVTGEDGSTTFSNLEPGSYDLSEDVKEGWEQTNIICEGTIPEPEEQERSNLCHKTASETHPWNAISVPDNNHSHDSHTADFPYEGPVAENGHPEGDGVGEAWCAENVPGEEVGIDQLFSPLVLSENLVLEDNEDQPAGSAVETLELEPGETITCQVLNTFIEPELRITKTNNSFPTEENPGDTVEYTLTVKALGNFVNDVTVTDLPPEGFEYEGGSANATSDNPGHVGPLELSHEYASPGVWSLGNMEAGETITLTYKTKISDNQDDGIYDDLAYARGTNGIGGDTLATDAGDPGDNFVGTLVAVATPNTQNVEIDTDNRTETDTETETQYVLGASLPATGASNKVVAAAILLLVAGFGLLFWDRRKSKMLMLSLFVFGGSIIATQVSAAGLAVEIEEPDAVVSSPNFKIGFVALDIQGRELEAQCKEASYGTFQTINLIAGGSSADCQVTDTVMPADGDYEFFVVVTAMGEGGEVVESDHVNVKLSSTRPGKPRNYDRDEHACSDKITFTTADDGGKTVAVELYRSTEKEFTAVTPIATLAIGSNADGSFDVGRPDCNEEYWYAIRAIDTHGHGSDFAADEDVDVDHETDTETETVILPGGTTGGGAIPTAGAAGAEAEGGQVEGAATGGENGEVLGEMTENKEGEGNVLTNWIKDHKVASTILGAGILYALYLLFMWYRNRFGTGNNV